MTRSTLLAIAIALPSAAIAQDIDDDSDPYVDTAETTRGACGGLRALGSAFGTAIEVIDIGDGALDGNPIQRPRLEYTTNEKVSKFIDAIDVVSVETRSWAGIKSLYR